MGMANKVPGVSGGTVSFVLGFYEEFIYSLQKLNLKALKLLITGRFRSFYRYVNGSFLFPVMMGSLLSYFTFSYILEYFIEHYDLYVWSLFFGMVIGSIIYILKDFRDYSKNNIIGMLLGAALGFGINFISQGTENDNLWYVFLCGIIGVSGMTLPGLSGSFILMLMGNYVLLMVESVNVLFKGIIEVFSGDFSIFSDPHRLHYIEVIVVFGLGSVFGMIALAQLLSAVLKRYHNLVIAIIIGFITGSLGAVWPWKTKVYEMVEGQITLNDQGSPIVRLYKHYWPDFSDSSTYIALVYIFVGIALVLLIDLLAQKMREND